MPRAGKSDAIFASSVERSPRVAAPREIDDIPHSSASTPLAARAAFLGDDFRAGSPAFPLLIDIAENTGHSYESEAMFNPRGKHDALRSRNSSSRSNFS